MANSYLLNLRTDSTEEGAAAPSNRSIDELVLLEALANCGASSSIHGGAGREPGPQSKALAISASLPWFASR